MWIKHFIGIEYFSAKLNLILQCVGFWAEKIRKKLLTRFNSKSIAFIAAIFYAFLLSIALIISEMHVFFLEFKEKFAPNVHTNVYLFNG